MKKLIFILLVCFMGFSVKAQVICGSTKYYEQEMATNPEFVKNQQQLELATQNYIKAKKASKQVSSKIASPIYTIPVVVHVLWNDNASIGDNQIKSQIEALNEAFQLKNIIPDSCPDIFKSKIANLNIAFELAKRDPNGYSTNGIVRVHTSIDQEFWSIWPLKDNAKFSSQGGDDAWDTSKYLNIWLVPRIYPSLPNYPILGYSSMPGGPIENDGVVIIFGAFGVGGSQVYQKYSLGKTTVHEIGHWLNLRHLQGNFYCGDDLVEDTPKQSDDIFDNPTYPQYSLCSMGKPEMTMNYMQYTDDIAKYMFTNDQKVRMYETLNSTFRSSIFRTDNLALVPPKAELTIINQIVNNNEVLAGNSITVYFAEDNNGGLPAAPNFVNFHLSTDDILTPGQNGDIYLDQFNIENGVYSHTCTKEYSKTIQIPLTVPSGTYYLYFAADATNLVDEDDNLNNFASVKITITSSATNNPPSNLIAFAGNQQVTLSWKAPLTGTPSTYSIYRSTSENGTYTQIANTIAISKTITGLSNDIKYWFYVAAVYTASEIASFKVSATPSAPIIVSNDDCSGAIKLTSSTSCNFLENQTVNNATASGKPKGLCDAYTGAAALADVWYYFTAQSTEHIVTVDPNGSQLDAVIVAYNFCTSSEIGCSDITGGPGTLSTLNLSGLTVGNPYYIRVYDYGVQTTSGNFNICVTGANSANSCAISSITPSSSTHSSSSFATTPGVDNINFVGQSNCSFEITDYCSWLTVTPIAGNTDSGGNGSVNYFIEANTTNVVRQCTFFINGNPVVITQNGETFNDDDNDGVKNELDKCPNTPTGEIVDTNGCSDNQLITEISSLQYNDVVLNTPNDRIIYFSNNGTTDYSITSVNISGINADQFSYSPTLPIVVAASNYQSITVTFNPTSVGAKDATVQITTDDATIPINTITLNGNGVDHLTKVLVCSPATSYNFGDTKVNVALSKTIVLQNTGSGTISVSDLTFEGLNNSDFSITSQVTLPFDILTGEFKVFVVTFLPTSNGSKNALLKITNNSDNLTPTHSIQLYGNAVEDIYSGNNNTLKAFEYWYDDQYNTKTTTAVNSYGDVILNTHFNTDLLNIGLHSLHIRYKDKKGKWSAVLSEYFHKQPITEVGPRKITENEYWFDDDYSIKFSTPITPNQTNNVNTGLDAISLQNGLHSYHVRYKDDQGNWSSVLSEYFYKQPITNDGPRKITENEYWFDDNYSAKITKPITPNQTITLNSAFDATILTEGLHSYHTRFKDDEGHWSSVVSEFFYKIKANALPTNLITGYRYWYDLEDSKMQSISLDTPISPYQLIKDISTCGLLAGSHTINFQFKDARNSWSAVFTNTFEVSADSIGCSDPQLDDDSDGVVNNIDLCPNTPAGETVDTNGCSIFAYLGDSNGDLSVNILDLVLDIEYILGHNPTPFIFSAADVNNDTFINVLDIVGTVDIILNPTSGKIISKAGESFAYITNSPVGEALFYWEGNDLYVESKEEIGGLQLAFDKDFKYTVSSDLPKFEWLNYRQEDKQILMMYSFNGISIKAGKTKLLTKTSENKVAFEIDKAVIGTPKGQKLTARFADKTIADIEDPFQSDQDESFLLGPNPTNGLLNIYYYLPEQMDKIQVSTYNLLGQKVWSSDAFKSAQGQSSASMDLSSLNTGMYIVVIEVLRNGALKKREVKQIILNK